MPFGVVPRATKRTRMDAGGSEQALKEAEQQASIDARMGFERVSPGQTRTGWLLNMQQTTTTGTSTSTDGGRGGSSGGSGGRHCSAVAFYFVQEDGAYFKAVVPHAPYLLLLCRAQREANVEYWLQRQFDDQISSIERVPKENLDLNNHLLGQRSLFLKISFRTTDDLATVKRQLMSIVKRNQQNASVEAAYYSLSDNNNNNHHSHGHDHDLHNPNSDDETHKLDKTRAGQHGQDDMIDIREHDVPYVARMAIDHDYRVGVWYAVSIDPATAQVTIEKRYDKLLPAEPVVLAFDIETSKAPLKFPDARCDPIMMISYMVDRQGFLITNREMVADDVADFDYSPKPGEFDGPFTVFNEPSERDLLHRFFEHVRNVRPAVFVTYNGDFFDWPYIEQRAQLYNMDLFVEIGFKKNDQDECYYSSYASHMDCLRWVKRDSYLPVGSQGLKSVTKSKLGYDPKELDPELMTPYARDCPHLLADYSVSDAVATYYLYMKYVHPFIFSLCYIIPLSPDDVLRKGSGTLCEMLLMVEAYKATVIMPNKHQDLPGRTFHGHLLSSETYVGGHVEALESGVFRSDLPTQFRISPAAMDQLIRDVDRALKFSIEVEERQCVADVENYEQVKAEIVTALQQLKARPNRSETPLIYHLDVAAMYPNIILTNRLQPPALVTEETCASCDFFEVNAAQAEGGGCQRKMQWSWRGEYFPADRAELNMIRNQLQAEKFPPRVNAYPTGGTVGASSTVGGSGEQMRSWADLSASEQASQIQKRLTAYCRKVYHKIRETKVQTKESIVCQRENSFYVDTVRNFRDRRYEYKGKLKVWKRHLDQAQKEGDPAKMDEAKKMIVLMDSLQLAHKCILNSFYGYVMRKGSRWYSMEMAGIVCLTGANIIRLARTLVEQIGRPLELDTDGIWCILPRTFPENFQFRLKNGKTMTISYPCVMLNHLVHDQFTNHQYQELVDPENFIYETRSENSIFFEVDGPYRAMILPASKEENKLLKKRYAVFNDDGTLAELKGFEVKRRGELKMIKIFQEEVFKVFLEGTSLEECYAAVACVADRWLDILYSKGQSVSDEELFDYISENRSMSKTLEEYGAQKSTSISTAKRLAEFLGDQMVKDKGLACHFIISQKPFGAPVTERAVPIAIFSAEPSVKKHFLRKWLHDNSLVSYDIRDILDWQYYIERFGSTVQKLITIPAAMQGVPNPVPRIQHPDWLLRRSRSKNSELKQGKITDVFGRISKDEYRKNLSRDFERSRQHRVLDVVDEEGGVGESEEVGDIEDGLVPKSKVKGAAKSGSDLVLPAEMPDPRKDYKAWLAYERIKWKLRRRNGPKNDQRGLDFKRSASSSLSMFLKQHNTIMLRRQWEVVQIAETEIAGEFKLWVLVDKTLAAVKLSIPRVFYVNCKEPDTSARFARVQKFLPRSQQIFNLYEFQLTEREYQEHADVYKTFAWHHDTIGMYETQVPLVFRALLSLGAVISVNRSKSAVFRKSIEERFELDDFVVSPMTAGQQYLDQNRIQYLFLYHSNSDTRHVLGLFVPCQSVLHVVVIDPFKNAAMPNLERWYEQLRKNEECPCPQSLEIKVSHFAQDADAFKAVSKLLKEFKDGRNGATALVVASGMSTWQLSSNIRVSNEFPVLRMPHNQTDDVYPALDWQRFAARRMFHSFFSFPEWLDTRLLMAKFSNIPVGNIEPDTLFLADLFFARNLVDHELLLWYSPTDRPDLGGREDDDNMYSLKELKDPEFNYPGFYPTVCIEYDLFQLPINALLQSTFINEAEGAHAYTGLSKADMASMEELLAQMRHEHQDNFDPNMPSFHAFKCLRECVRLWNKEYHTHGNPVGALLVQHFFQWISSPQSRMYDPCLYAYVHGLMKKALIQLLGEFQRLGSKVVYASLNKIVIVTTKTSAENARVYSDFILKTIKKKDVFRHLILKPTVYWDQLLWMDVRNHGGICGGEVTLNWDMARYLPKFVREQFDLLVYAFITRMQEVRGEQRKVTTGPVLDKVALHKRECQMLRTDFLPEFLDIIKQIQEADPEDIGPFPDLPGSCAEKMSNPALELIKFVCHVFSLVPQLQDAVRLMRQKCLQLVGVSDFSPLAEFWYPGLTCQFILKHISCTYCNDVRDLDLLLLDVASHGAEDGQPTSLGFRCPDCHNEYDLPSIEQQLISLVEKVLLSYQLQDLQCVKCAGIKMEHAREHCKTCASAYELVGIDPQLNSSAGAKASEKKARGTTRAEVVSRLRVLSDLAEYYEFGLLNQVLQWTLSII